MKDKRKTIKKCLECGSGDFDINEFIVHRACLGDNDKDLIAYKVKNHGIEMIVCSNCEKEYNEDDFKEIGFY